MASVSGSFASAASASSASSPKIISNQIKLFLSKRHAKDLFDLPATSSASFSSGSGASASTWASSFQNVSHNSHNSLNKNLFAVMDSIRA
jgi:hypothetical protein